MKLQTKLLLFIAPVVIITSMIIGGVAFLYWSKDARNQVLIESQQILTQTESSFNDYIKDTQNKIDIISNSGTIQEYIANRQDRINNQSFLDGYLKDIENSQKYMEAFYITDQNGRFLKDYRNQSQDRNLQLAIEAARKNTTGETSEPLFSNGYTYYSSQVKVGREVLGYIAVKQSLAFFSQVSNNYSSSGDILFLIHNNKIAEDPSGLVSQKDIQQLSLEFFNKGSREEIRVGGKPYYAFSLALKDNMTIVGLRSLESGRSEITQMGQYIFLISLITGVLLSLLLHKFMRLTVLDRIDELQEFSENISIENFDFNIITKGSDEISQLSRSFDQMKNSLIRTRDRNKELAFYDELTKLGNLRSLRSAMDMSIKDAKANNSRLAVIAMDVDNLKDTNDSVGHYSGDMLLKSIAERLDFVVKNFILQQNGQKDLSYIVARIEGDQFAIIISNHRSSSVISKLAKEINHSFTLPFELQGLSFIHTMSIGITEYPYHGETKEALLQNSDTAMYWAKKYAKGQSKWFDETLAEKAKEKKELADLIRNAIDNDEFIIHYQPKVREGMTVVNEMEALIRWPREQGSIPPGKFIPFAEENGLIDDIGNWVVEQVCRDVRILEDMGYKDFKISFNSSPNQLKGSYFRMRLNSLIHQYDINGNHLEMEITEHSFAEDINGTITSLEHIKKLGVSIALDDFGTGYSSLSLLERLPIDTIKIDRSFISMCDKNPAREAIIDMITTLAKGLNINTVAEGVERIEESDLVFNKGCTLIQGFYYYKPMPLEELIRKSILKKDVVLNAMREKIKQ